MVPKIAPPFSVCKTTNKRSCYISNTEDIDIKWFENSKSVGLTGATSTPGWLIEQIAEFIKDIYEELSM